MPFARIELVKGRSAAQRKIVSEVVYESMLETLKAPKDDWFQVITERDPDCHIADENYLGIRRTKDCIIVQLFLNQGRTVEQKKAYCKAVCDGLHHRLGLRREDVFINLVEVAKENWSFGNGEAQYA